MKRWALWVLLLLSLGVNVGILATLLVQHWRQPAPEERALRDWLETDPVAEEPAATQAAAPEPIAPPIAPQPAAPAPRRPETQKPRDLEPRASVPRPETLEPVVPEPPQPEASAPQPAAPQPAAPAPAAGDLAPLRADRVFQNLADRLDLAGESRDRFIAIQRRAFDSMRAERERMLIARAALRRELAAASPNQPRVDALLAEATAAQSAMEQTLVSSVLDSRALLDPAQQRLYMRFVEERLRPAATMPQRRALRERFLNHRGGHP